MSEFIPTTTPQLSQQENLRPIWRFVRMHNLESKGNSWGFAIFRTIYTPESYQNWEIIMEKMNAYNTDALLDPEPNRVVGETFKSVVPDDQKKWDGENLHEIRKVFEELWTEGRFPHAAWIHRQVCLVIDEDTFKAILSAPEPSVNGLKEVLITAVDHYGDQCPDKPDGYEGWVKVNAWELQRLWSIMEYSEGLRMKCEKGKDGAYHFE